ncbi:(deoxy)nucleoside triphosphate pyrophosphohydrolase [Desertivirga brevis]|uniref:(deoxy)nucleoside triphosphate pyrophosphohydrolase n=1 Tax=Desertivirga brevis TaxID=2810310 RepID=UPI001A970DE5|nr:(deoxy)nucleoside triphosphate pyrophosphohydrolase [Pedobacter sp. SYSU D00873]
MINVACAVIADDQGRILAVQRSALMPHAFKWEFPGGKVEDGETSEVALCREIMEELGVEIKVAKALAPTTHAYSSTKIIRLIPFICRITKGKIKLSEHQEHQWLEPARLSGLDWVEADLPIVASLLGYPQSDGH